MTNETESAAVEAAFKIFGDMLRKQRQKSKWTFRELAEHTSVNEDIISQLEAGENVGTEADHETLSEFLGIRIGTFAKLLRTQKAQMAKHILPLAEASQSKVVNLEGYRARWAKTTTHPEA